MGSGMMGMDINDIEYDAYLANDRTLNDPEVVTWKRAGGFVCASSTARQPPPSPSTRARSTAK